MLGALTADRWQTVSRSEDSLVYLLFYLIGKSNVKMACHRLYTSTVRLIISRYSGQLIKLYLSSIDNTESVSDSNSGIIFFHRLHPPGIEMKGMIKQLEFLGLLLGFVGVLGFSQTLPVTRLEVGDRVDLIGEAVTVMVGELNG